MQENGIVVNECAKIHCEDRTQEDHAIICKGYDFHIPLQLHGIFSYFVTRKPDVGLLTEFRQPLQVQSHLEMPGILVQLGHIQRT